jgi:hypothetical protein
MKPSGVTIAAETTAQQTSQRNTTAKNTITGGHRNEKMLQRANERLNKDDAQKWIYL